MKIKDLNISARARTCLINAGYLTIEEIKDLMDDDLKKIHNINNKCVKEIRDAITEYNDAKKDDSINSFIETTDQASHLKSNRNAEGVQAYNLGNYKLAVSLFMDSLAYDDGTGYISANLGNAYAALVKKYSIDYVDEALKYAEKAFDKNNAEAAFTLASLYDPNLTNNCTKKICSADKAVNYYISYLELTNFGEKKDPSSALNNLSVIMYTQKTRYDLAAICAELALKYNPKDVHAKKNKEIYLKRLSENSIDNITLVDSIKDAVSMIKKMQPTVDNTNYLGLLANQEGNYREAVRYFTSALDQDDKTAYVHWNLGNAYYNLSFSENVDYIQEAKKYLLVALERKNPQAAYVLGEICSPIQNALFPQYCSINMSVKYYKMAIEYSNGTRHNPGAYYNNLGCLYGDILDNAFAAAAFCSLALQHRSDSTIVNNYKRFYSNLSAAERCDIQQIKNYNMLLQKIRSTRETE